MTRASLLTIHCGGGGCFWIFIDMDARTAFVYAADKMDRQPLSDPRPFDTMKAMWRSLGIRVPSVRSPVQS